MVSIIQILISTYIFVISIFDTRVYTEGILENISTLDPTRAQSDSEKVIARLVYRSLYKYDLDGNLIPDLAKSYEISDDGLTYTINLLDNVSWHNGEEITAKDVIYTASKINSLREIGTDMLGEKTIRFLLPNKYSPFLSILTFPIVSSSAGNIGSGDFRIVKIKQAGSGINQVSLYTQNPSYKYRKIVLKQFANESDLKNAYKLGEIDGFMSSSNFSWVGLNINNIPLLGRYFVLHFNTSREPFLKKDNRKLAAESINREEFNNLFVNNPSLVTQGAISNNQFTKNDLDNLVYNPDITPLKDRIKINALVPDLENMQESITYIINSLQKVGFDATVSKLSQTQIQAEIAKPRDYDIFILGEEVGRDPDRYVFWHSTQKDSPGLNLSSFSNLRVDKALEKGREEIESDKRKEHYEIFQTAINEEVPAIFLYHPGVRYFLSENISPSSFDKLYYPYERFYDFVNWK